MSISHISMPCMHIGRRPQHSIQTVQVTALKCRVCRPCQPSRRHSTVILRRCVGDCPTTFTPQIHTSRKRYTQLCEKSISFGARDILFPRRRYTLFINIQLACTDLNGFLLDIIYSHYNQCEMISFLPFLIEILRI